MLFFIYIHTVAVTVAFIVCWAPFHAQRLMTIYVPHWTPHLLDVQSHIFYISGEYKRVKLYAPLWTLRLLYVQSHIYMYTIYLVNINVFILYVSQWTHPMLEFTSYICISTLASINVMILYVPHSIDPLFVECSV